MRNLIQLHARVQGRRVNQKRTETSLSLYMVCTKRLVALGTELLTLTHSDIIGLALEWGQSFVLVSIISLVIVGLNI